MPLALNKPRWDRGKPYTMILIIQIALGIVLAVVLLNHWRPIITWSGRIAFVILAVALAIGAFSLLSGFVVYLNNEFDLVGKLFLVVALLIALGVAWLSLYSAVKIEESISTRLRKVLGLGIGDIFAFVIFGAIAFLGLSIVRMAFLGNQDSESTLHQYIAGSIFLVIGVGMIFMQNNSIKKRKLEQEKKMLHSDD